MSFWGKSVIFIYFVHSPEPTTTGYKFETLSLIPRPWGDTPREYIEGREEQIVNNHAQYCCVVKTGIGKTRMILGGEVDAGISNPYTLPV